jgi:hypothetical protein
MSIGTQRDRRLTVDALVDHRVDRLLPRRPDAPVDDALVLLQEGEASAIDEPPVRGEESVVRLVQATFPTGDEVIVAQGPGQADAGPPLRVRDLGLVTFVAGFQLAAD